MITINATVYVNKDAIKEYKALTNVLIPGTQNELGNLRYDMYQSIEQPTEFVFIEQYADQAALDAHHNADHFTSFLKNVAPFLSKDMDVSVFHEVPKSE